MAASVAVGLARALCGQIKFGTLEEVAEREAVGLAVRTEAVADDELAGHLLGSQNRIAPQAEAAMWRRSEQERILTGGQRETSKFH